MAPWDVSTLVGARVLFADKDAEGTAHEARGTIVAVLQTHAADKESEAVNGSEFSVRTDAGAVLPVAGSSISRIDPAASMAETAESAL